MILFSEIDTISDYFDIDALFKSTSIKSQEKSNISNPGKSTFHSNQRLREAVVIRKDAIVPEES